MDFNGDGRPDLLSGSNCCDSFAFHVFLAKGKNTWESRKKYQVDSNSKFSGGFRIQHQSFVSAADWDGDGIPDLLWHVNPGIGVVRGPIRAENPLDVADEIAFTPRPVTDEEYVYDFVIADWDRDGKPDLLVRMKLRGNRSGIYWYRNLGERGLKELAPGELVLSDQQLANSQPPNHWGVYSFCAGDWDGDGWPDLILSRQDLVGDTKSEWQSSVWLYRRE